MDFFDIIVPNDVTQPCSSSQPARQALFSFLFSHPSSWDKSSTYLKVKDSIDRLPVVNDTERDLGLLTEYHQSTASKSEGQKQYIFKIVKEMRVQQANQATSSESVTKKLLGMRSYKYK